MIILFKQKNRFFFFFAISRYPLYLFLSSSKKRAQEKDVAAIGAKKAVLFKTTFF